MMFDLSSIVEALAPIARRTAVPDCAVSGCRKHWQYYVQKAEDLAVTS